MLHRVPGNFHVLARSANHDLEPQMTNTSHMVNTLSIGHPLMHRLGGIPPEIQSKLRPMNGNVYPTFELHRSYHHYLKIVIVKTEYVNLYPININSQLTNYERDTIPERQRHVTRHHNPIPNQNKIYHNTNIIIGEICVRFKSDFGPLSNCRTEMV